MKTRLRRRAGTLFLGLLLSTLTWPAATSAVIHNMAEAVEFAATQSTLTQRMLRDYALAGMGVKYHDPSADLKESVARFDSQLKDLQTYEINADISAAVAEVSKLWVPVKAVLEAQPEQARAAKLHDDSEALLAASQKVSALVAKASGTSASHTVDVSSRQIMLGQRMAAMYVLRAWGVGGEAYLPDYHKAVEDFGAGQQELEKSELNTPEISAELAAAKKSFFWFKMGDRQDHGEGEHFTPALILRATERIDSHMAKATSLYAQLNK